MFECLTCKIKVFLMLVNSAFNSSGDVTQLKSKRASAPMLRNLKNVRNSFIKLFSFHEKKMINHKISVNYRMQSVSLLL
ncbi:hypothetical protein SODG_007496 [Sodalis praecaptivus]